MSNQRKIKIYNPVFVFCLVYRMLPASLDCPLLITPSVFSNVYIVPPGILLLTNMVKSTWTDNLNIVLEIAITGIYLRRVWRYQMQISKSSLFSNIVRLTSINVQKYILFKNPVFKSRIFSGCLLIYDMYELWHLILTFVVHY